MPLHLLFASDYLSSTSPSPLYKAIASSSSPCSRWINDHAGQRGAPGRLSVFGDGRCVQSRKTPTPCVCIPLLFADSSVICKETKKDMSLSQENAGVGGGGVTSNTSNEQTSIILQSLPTLSSSYPPQETPDKPLQDELEPSAKPDVSEDKRGEPTKPAGDSDKLQTMAELEHEPGPIRLVDDEHDDQVTLNSKHKLPRRVAFWWMFALYLVMFLAGECRPLKQRLEMAHPKTK